MPPITGQKQTSNVKDAVQKTILLLYKKLNIPYTVTPYDQTFHNLCCERAVQKGYPIGSDPGSPSLLPYIPAGVIMGSVGFGHLEDEEHRLFVAFYTSFLIYVDSVYESDSDGAKLFAERFLRGQKQEELVLDGLARFLKEIPEHFEPVAAGLVLTGALNLINACTLEYQTRDMKASIFATGYPHFTRQMSGANEAYTVMIFPRNIPLESYIQCLPEAGFFLGHANDVMSFYKEEVAGETANYISVLSGCEAIPKLEAFEKLASQVAQADMHVCKILNQEAEALTNWNTFKSGYMSFHASYGRYRLEEVMQNI